MNPSADETPPTNEPFTTEEYLKLLDDYTLLRNTRAHPSIYIQSIQACERTYRERLPRYLLARCPICGGHVSERIDTFSLRGLGWNHTGFRGGGWFGAIPIKVPVSSNQKLIRGNPHERPSYDSACRHVQLVDWCVNFNDQAPVDVDHFIELSDVPHLIEWIMTNDQMMAVMRRLEINHIGYPDLMPYQAYFTTYFAQDEHLLDKIVAQIPPLDDVWDDLLIAEPYDYDLLKWVKQGRLYWLDQNSPDLPLRNTPTDDFPFGNVKGFRRALKIENGEFWEYTPPRWIQWLGKLVEWKNAKRRFNT